MLPPGAPDASEADAARFHGSPSTPSVPPPVLGKEAGNATAKWRGSPPFLAAKGKTGRRTDRGGSAQPRKPPSCGPSAAGDAAQPIALASGAAPGNGAQPEAAGMVLWRDAVEPVSARVLGYTN